MFAVLLCLSFFWLAGVSWCIMGVLEEWWEVLHALWGLHVVWKAETTSLKWMGPSYWQPHCCCYSSSQTLVMISVVTCAIQQLIICKKIMFAKEWKSQEKNLKRYHCASLRISASSSGSSSDTCWLCKYWRSLAVCKNVHLLCNKDSESSPRIECPLGSHCSTASILSWYFQTIKKYNHFLQNIFGWDCWDAHFDVVWNEMKR